METKLGRVSSVFVDEELNRVFVSVVNGPESEQREIPFITSKPSFWLIPQEGDIVEIATVDRERVARFPHGGERPQLPEGLGEGDVCLKLDDGTELKFQKSGNDYDVSISASGDVHIDSASSITIGDDSKAVNVAVQDHTHSYSWGDDSGSGTTGTANQPGTDTKIQ